MLNGTFERKAVLAASRTTPQQCRHACTVKWKDPLSRIKEDAGSHIADNHTEAASVGSGTQTASTAAPTGSRDTQTHFDLVMENYLCEDRTRTEMPAHAIRIAHVKKETLASRSSAKRSLGDSARDPTAACTQAEAWTGEPGEASTAIQGG